MKIIYMSCNYKKSERRKNREEQKRMTNAINKVFSKEYKEKINNLSKEELNIYLNKIDNNINNLSNKDLKDSYLNFLIVEKKLNYLKYNKSLKEVALTDDLNKDEIVTVKEDNYSKINGRFSKLINKLNLIVTNKHFKRIAMVACTLLFSVLTYIEQNATVACATGMPTAINTAYAYIKAIAGVVCFLCMTVEIVQSALHGDVRVIWYIVAKYLAILVAFLSFKSIYDIIDNVFNG